VTPEGQHLELKSTSEVAKARISLFSGRTVFTCPTPARLGEYFAVPRLWTTSVNGYKASLSLRGDMNSCTYSVTASTGGSRSLPWPFGRCEVSDAYVRIRSWHFAWWVRDYDIRRDAVETITISKRFGATTIMIHETGGGATKVNPPTSAHRMVEDLRSRRYPIA
jgi:hypothetical protein